MGKTIEENRWTNGGSPKKHFYTVADIANFTGRAVGTIRNDSYNGKVALDDFESVVGYCVRYIKDDEPV